MWVSAVSGLAGKEVGFFLERYSFVEHVSWGSGSESLASNSNLADVSLCI